MFKVKTNGSSDLKAVFNSISTLSEEATFFANKDGITFRGMDPSHIALIDLSLPSSAFSEYECDKDEIRFGIRMDNIGKIIKRSKKDDDITMTISEMNNLVIKIGDTKEFEVRLIEADTEKSPLPKVEYDSTAIVPVQKLIEFVNDIGVISEDFVVETDEETIKFSGKGDSGKANVTYTPETINGSGSIKHDLKYLLDILSSFVEKNFNCDISLSTNKPIKYEFQIAGVGKIKFFMAPRVED